LQDEGRADSGDYELGTVFDGGFRANAAHTAGQSSVFSSTSVREHVFLFAMLFRRSSIHPFLDHSNDSAILPLQRPQDMYKKETQITIKQNTQSEAQVTSTSFLGNHSISKGKDMVCRIKCQEYPRAR
jgi:hypothetical protein